MNNVSILGNITRDLELKEFGSTKVLSFSVAVQKRVKDKNTGEYGTNYINCKAFNRTAEIIAQHFAKGSQIGIEGEIDTGKYEKDGKTIYTTDVVVRNITFVERKGQSDTNNQQQRNNASTPPQNANSNNPFANATGPIDISDDDLPF
ncbi:single-stranded DNA-binding protein [Macrococcoides caseolyticum]|uniref:Single-stranded DNA-binding protein n=2 Tax=Macrococcoides caseolyticum TaxID=69966 RepID=A0ACC9MPC5_9STAP|nr:single-stranded DNA-binding protein [Macrococcus caseolyticus]PKE55494.1 single-stranded DNA-binding protein [Macrococcus caseolyticus]